MYIYKVLIHNIPMTNYQKGHEMQTEIMCVVSRV